MKRTILLLVIFTASLTGFTLPAGELEITRSGSFLSVQSVNETFALISSFDSEGRQTEHVERIAVNINNIISIDMRETSGMNYVIRIFVDRNREVQFYEITISSSFRAETAYKSILEALAW